jgi:hypothetical protein
VVEGPAGIQSKTRAYDIDLGRPREPVRDMGLKRRGIEDMCRKLERGFCIGRVVWLID